MTGLGRCALNPPIHQCSLNFWSFQRCPESIPTRQRWLEGPSSHMNRVIKFFLKDKKIFFFSKNFIGSLTTLFHWFSLSKSSLRLIQGPPRAWGMILRRNWCPALVYRLMHHVQRKFSRLAHHIRPKPYMAYFSTGADLGWLRSAFCVVSGAVDKWFIVLVDTFGIRTEFDLLWLLFLWRTYLIVCGGELCV